MARSSRSLLDLSLPCRPQAAASLAERLEKRLRLEASSGLLMAALSLVGLAASLTLPEPPWARALYAALFALFSALSLVYYSKRKREAEAVAVLRARLLEGKAPSWLCDATLRDLLERALADYGKRAGKQ